MQTCFEKGTKVPCYSNLVGNESKVHTDNANGPSLIYYHKPDRGKFIVQQTSLLQISAAYRISDVLKA